MPRLHIVLFAAMFLALQGCTTTDTTTEPVDPDSVELTLNLPEEGCRCVVEPEADYTFLERGFLALTAGEHIEAVQHLQRYARLEKSPSADWESAVTIAYLSMLPSSPFYDPDAAAAAYERLNPQLTDELVIHPRVLLMRESLEAFVEMDRHVGELESVNGTLREDLAKREEALKRLRELTLGQQKAVR